MAREVYNFNFPPIIKPFSMKHLLSMSMYPDIKTKTSAVALVTFNGAKVQGYIFLAINNQSNHFVPSKILDNKAVSLVPYEITFVCSPSYFAVAMTSQSIKSAFLIN